MPPVPRNIHEVARDWRTTLIISTAMSTFFQSSVSCVGAEPSIVVSQTIPMVDEGTLIRVPVRVFDRTNYFFVDTGSTYSAFDLRLESKLGIPLEEINQENALVGSLKTKLYTAPEISLGKVKLNISRVFCSDLSLARMITGEPCDGILGIDALKDYAVVLDFERSTLALYSKTPEDIRRRGISIPLVSFFNHYQFEATADGQTKLKLLVDSSSGNTVSLVPLDWEKTFKGKTNDTVPTLSGVVGGKIAESKIARINKLTFGSESLTNLGCSLLHNVTSSSSVGLPFLRRYRVAIDFPEKMLYLAPRSEPANEEEHDMSGLHLLRISGLVTVHSVDPDSPADRAGIKAGDSIAAIDGKDCDNVAMRDIRLRLKSKDGDVVKIKLNRQGETLQMEFLLRKVI
jgi:hypothetical protein